MKNVRIGTKILIVILLTALVSLSLISVIAYSGMLSLTRQSQDANIQLGVTSSQESREALLDQARAYLGKLALEQAKGSDATLSQVQAEVSALRGYMSNLYAYQNTLGGHEIPHPTDTEQGVACAKYFLAKGVVQTPAIAREVSLISNAELMFGPTFLNNETLHNCYLGTQSGISYRFSRANSYNPDYDPRTRGWYEAAMASPGQTLWVDTYVDAYGQICVTCCGTFTGENGQVAGVVAADITLSSMKEAVLATNLGEGGYAFLLDNAGTLLAHPRYEDDGFNLTPITTATADYKTVLTDMTAGKTGVNIVEIDGTQAYLAYAPLETTGWSLGVVVPIASVVGPAEETKNKIDRYTDDAQAYIRETLSQTLVRFIIIFAACAMFVVLCSFFLSGTILKPIRSLAGEVRRISAGDLDAKIPIRGKDELAELGGAFNQMTDDLKAYIANLQTVTAEKERINGELSVASRIQDDMLPHIFPTFEAHPYFELTAKMTAAKMVGGDFFDFFFLDPEQRKLCVVIADVSGKGVPAALFMVIAKTLLKTHMMSGETPEQALTCVNNLLCEENASGMFVTTFVAVFDLDEQVCHFSNAGHNAPVLRHRGEAPAFMKLKRALPLGGMENIRYRADSMPIAAGDLIVFYTDGVTEAMNPQNELFSDPALLHTVAGLPDTLPVGEIDDAIRRAVAHHVNGAEQSDDITTVVLRIKTAKGVS